MSSLNTGKCRVITKKKKIYAKMVRIVVSNIVLYSYVQQELKITQSAYSKVSTVWLRDSEYTASRRNFGRRNKIFCNIQKSFKNWPTSPRRSNSPRFTVAQTISTVFFSTHSRNRLCEQAPPQTQPHLVITSPSPPPNQNRSPSTCPAGRKSARKTS